MALLECKKCGATVSGPDEKDVLDTMKRHTEKKHPKAKK